MSFVPRDTGTWWCDADGTEWSAFALYKERNGTNLRRVAWDETAGAQMFERDGKLIHLVRIPPPEATRAERRAFYVCWDLAGEPP